MEKDYDVNLFVNSYSSNWSLNIDERNGKDKPRSAATDSNVTSLGESQLGRGHRIKRPTEDVRENSKRTRRTSSSSDESRFLNSKSCPPASKIPKISDESKEVIDGNYYQRLKVIEVNLSSTLNIVGKILTELRNLKQHVLPKNSDYMYYVHSDNNEYTKKIKDYLPLETKEAVADFEQLLIEDQFYREFVRILYQVGGSSAKSCTERILSMTFSPLFAKNNTWEGKINKYSVKNLTVSAIIEEVLLKKYPTWDRAEFGKTGINWFRLGNQRAKSQPGQLKKKTSATTNNNETARISKIFDDIHFPAVENTTPRCQINKISHRKMEPQHSLKTFSNNMRKTFIDDDSDEESDFNLIIETEKDNIKTENNSVRGMNDENQIENVVVTNNQLVTPSNNSLELRDSEEVIDNNNYEHLKVVKVDVQRGSHFQKSEGSYYIGSDVRKKIKGYLPLETKEAVAEFEHLLTEDKYYCEFVQILNQVGGSHARDCTERILTTIFSHLFAKNNTWEGKINKYSVKKLIITEIVEEVVLKKYPTWNRVEFGKTGINWFRLGNQRAGSQPAQLKKKTSATTNNNETNKMPIIYCDKIRASSVDNTTPGYQINEITHSKIKQSNSLERYSDKSRTFDVDDTVEEIVMTLTDETENDIFNIKTENDSDIGTNDDNQIEIVTGSDNQLAASSSNNSVELRGSEEVFDENYYNYQRLQLMEAEIRDLKQQLITNNSGYKEPDSNEYTKKIKDYLPLETKEAVTDFEQLLTDDQFYCEFVRILNQVGGSNAKDCTERMLTKVFAPLFAKNNTWEGKINKYSVKNLTVTAIIEDIILKKFPTWDSVHFGKTGINWFRLGNQRAGSQPGQLKKKTSATTNNNESM